MRQLPPWERPRFTDEVDELERIPYGRPSIPRPTQARGLARPGLSFPATRSQQPTNQSKLSTYQNPILDRYAKRVALQNGEPASYRMLAKDLITRGPKSLSTSDAVKQAVSALKRRQQLAAQLQPAPRRPGVAAKAIAADRRSQIFGGFPKTTFGTFAHIVPRHSGRLKFLAPGVVVPCIQRTTRREVLFAKGRAGGHGSRRPKRKGPHSHIGC